MQKKKRRVRPNENRSTAETPIKATFFRADKFFMKMKENIMKEQSNI